MKIIIVFLITFSIFYKSNQLDAQNQSKEYDAFLVVNASRLSIRDEPSLESKKIGVVEKDELVKVIDNRSADKYLVTVDGIKNRWIKIEYNNIIGYMFGGYLSCCAIYQPNSNWKGKYLVMVEGSADVMYSADFKWYGIYSRKDGEYIESVNITVEYGQEGIENLKTNKKEQSKRLIGTREDIRLGKVGIPTKGFTNETLTHNHRIPIPFYEKDLQLNTNLYLQGYCPYFSDHSGCDYTYAINLNDLEKYGLTVHTFDDFECRRTKHQALDWFGDINGDSIPDFIFNHLTTYASFDHLYISEKIKDKVSYKKVN